MKIGESFTVDNSHCHEFHALVEAGIYSVSHGTTHSTYTRLRYANWREKIRLFFS